MKTILSLVLVLSAISLSHADTAQGQTQPTLTVNGSSTIRVVPDEMEFVTEVMSSDKSRDKAKESHDQTLTQVLAFLKAEGSAITKLQTGGMRLDKQQLPPQVRSSVIGSSVIGSSVLGPVYTCTTLITFTLSDLAKYGELADGLANIQDFLIDNTNYAYSKAAETQRTAMVQAVTHAHDDAQALAAATNCTITGVQNIQYGGGMQPHPFMRMASPMMAGASGSGTPPAEAGQIEITEDVIITYKIDNSAQPLRTSGLSA